MTFCEKSGNNEATYLCLSLGVWGCLSVNIMKLLVYA